MNRDVKTHVRVPLGVFTHLYTVERDYLSLGAEWFYGPLTFSTIFPFQKIMIASPFYYQKKQFHLQKQIRQWWFCPRANPGESDSQVLMYAQRQRHPRRSVGQFKYTGSNSLQHPARFTNVKWNILQHSPVKTGSAWNSLNPNWLFTSV